MSEWGREMAKQETRQMLVEAFFSIYREKPVNRISIKEVTDKAGFHRSTFYEYFSDIYDLLEQEEAEIYSLQKSLILDPVEKKALSLHSRELLKPLGKLFEMKGGKIAVLIGAHGDAAFRKVLQERIKGILIPEIAGVEDAEVEYIAEFVSSGLLSVLEMAYSNNADMDDVMTILYPIVSKLPPFSSMHNQSSGAAQQQMRTE